MEIAKSFCDKNITYEPTVFDNGDIKDDGLDKIISVYIVILFKLRNY